jgi:hypothetical protein
MARTVRLGIVLGLSGYYQNSDFSKVQAALKPYHYLKGTILLIECLDEK